MHSSRDKMWAAAAGVWLVAAGIDFVKGGWTVGVLCILVAFWCVSEIGTRRPG